MAVPEVVAVHVEDALFVAPEDAAVHNATHPLFSRDKASARLVLDVMSNLVRLVVRSIQNRNQFLQSSLQYILSALRTMQTLEHPSIASIPSLSSCRKSPTSSKQY